MAIDEAARLAALRRYDILDTEPERAFDDLALLAAHICGTPMALISLVDAERQWFKARVNVPVSETDRSVSFCTHAIQQPDLFIIPDARADERFRDNPFVVTDPGIRFYAGAPFVTPDGHALGTLCVFDNVPRTLSPEQARALEALKRQLQVLLELRLNFKKLGMALAERDAAEETQDRLIVELRSALDKESKLAALVPLCSTCQFDIVIPADPSAIPTVTEGVLKVLADRKWAEDEIIKVELALQEALANGIRHGAKGDPSKKIQCVVTCDERGEIVIVVRDPGQGFDRSAVANPLEPANMLKSSGRGIFLIDQLMDEVSFADGGREVQMRKRREKTPVAGA